MRPFEIPRPAVPLGVPAVRLDVTDGHTFDPVRQGVGHQASYLSRIEFFGAPENGPGFTHCLALLLDLVHDGFDLLAERLGAQYGLDI